MSGTEIFKSIISATERFRQGLSTFAEMCVDLITRPFFVLVSEWSVELGNSLTGDNPISVFLGNITHFVNLIVASGSPFAEYTILELMLGVGLWSIIAYTIAKWIADIIF